MHIKIENDGIQITLVKTSEAVDSVNVFAQVENALAYIDENYLVSDKHPVQFELGE